MLGKNLIQAAAGNAGGEVLGIEDVFSTWLYTGNGSTQTITNGIDLAGEGGLVWIKGRGGSAADHLLYDTNRGATKGLLTNGSSSTFTNANTLTSFTTTGFNVGSYVYVNGGPGGAPTFPETFASWTFRKAPGFFDVVTYTGTGVARTVAHNLGSVPGTIIVKRTDSVADWQVYHRSLANTEYMVLNSTAAKATGTTRWNSTTPTSSVFSLGTDATVNASGGTYVAYLFAHDEQIFGESGDQSVIKCGSYTGTGSNGNVINLGWEPQWVLIKNASAGSTDWVLYDTMRGMPNDGSGTAPGLVPNLANAESALYPAVIPLATGFQVDGNSTFTNTSPNTFVYIAIRRPMKIPESGSSVLALSTSTGVGIMHSNTGITSDHQTINDAVILRPYRAATTAPSWVWVDQLRGIGASSSPYLNSSSTAFETTTTLVKKGTDNYLNFSGSSFPTISYTLRRAPGFFDAVAYTGTGSATTISHNLGVVPELMIVKQRNATNQWVVGSSGLTSWAYYLQLSATNAESAFNPAFNSTAPTDAVFTVGTSGATNGSSNTYIAYLFATCPGVSKVGSYTGNGFSTQDINCGFTAGARFVLIKRTDSTGDWYVWDTARGIVNFGNDPYLLLNSTAAEVTNTDYLQPLNAGFQVYGPNAWNTINVSGATYIYLAIA